MGRSAKTTSVPRPAELLDEEHLIGVAARETVRREDVDLVDHACGYGVAQPLQGRAQERGAAVALVDELILGGDRQAGGGDPLAQRRELAGHRVAAGLLFAGHSRVQGDPGLRHAHPSASSARRPRQARAPGADAGAGT